VSVTDQGVGITKQQQETLFHPFYTTKPSGMGLGLSICETIIEAHNGKLSYSPGKPKGSVFSFTLPAQKS
jgi:signal transduction histidine kinase